MADEAGRYTDKKFEITPFGVDMKLFHPDKRTGGEAERLSVLKKEDFVVGTVKALSDKYGISYLLKAVAEVRKHTVIPIKLRIAGKGVQEEEYRQLAETLQRGLALFLRMRRQRSGRIWMSRLFRPH